MGLITHLILSGGERYPMLLDGEGMPDYWVTLYITERLRPSLKQTTIENTIRSLIHLRLWESLNERNLISEISRERFLSESDICSIRDHCLLETRSLRKWHQTTKNKNVFRLAVNAPTSSQHFQSVSKHHVANRLVHIADFLYFIARTILRQRSNFSSLTDSIDDIKKRMNAQKPKGLGDKGLANDPDSKAPPPEVFEKLMSIIKEDSPDNPYKNVGVRNRNALMFDVLYETGMRAGGVLALQIGDITFRDNCKIEVQRRHDNSLDPRAKQPVEKTLGRTIPISEILAKKLSDYIMNVRSTIPNANKHPYVFVTHKPGRYQGQPISDSSFRNRVLRTATKTNPELFEEITRHGFRHNFNYRLSKKIDAHNERARHDPNIEPIKPKEELQIRKQLNGWSSDETAQVYNLRHIQELANQLMREEMDDLSKHLNRG
nr:site-specific integrase [uncultured Deefgea sp.]